MMESSNRQLLDSDLLPPRFPRVFFMCFVSLEVMKNCATNSKKLQHGWQGNQKKIPYN